VRDRGPARLPPLWLQAGISQSLVRHATPRPSPPRPSPRARVVAVVLAVWAAGGQLELGVAQVRDALKTEMAVACTPPLGRRGSSRGRGGSGYGTVG